MVMLPPRKVVASLLYFVKKLDVDGFLNLAEVRKEMVYHHYLKLLQMRPETRVMRLNFTTGPRGRGSTKYSALDLLGDKWHRTFYVLDPVKFQAYKVAHMANELEGLFLLRLQTLGEDVEAVQGKRRAFTGQMHALGLHWSGCCNYHRIVMDVKKAWQVTGSTPMRNGVATPHEHQWENEVLGSEDYHRCKVPGCDAWEMLDWVPTKVNLRQ